MNSGPSSNKSERYKVWIKQAEYDLEAAKLSLEGNFYEWVCFQSQQVVEKALKGILVKSGWSPPRIHKLAILIGMANDADERFRNTKVEFRDLEAFTFISRYPFLIPGVDQSPHEFITRKEATQCLSQAEIFLQKVRNLLNA